VWDGKLVEEVVDRLGIEKMDGGKRGRKMQYVKVFWKKKSKKFTARTGGKFAVNDSFLEKKFVENYFKKAKSQHGKVLINVKGCDIKTKQDSCGN